VRSAASFFKLIEDGRLIDPHYSSVAKKFLERISTSKFLKGIQLVCPNVNWFGKTGTYNGNLSEVALIEGPGYAFILAFLISGHRENDVFEYLGKAATSFVCEQQLGRW